MHIRTYTHVECLVGAIERESCASCVHVRVCYVRRFRLYVIRVEKGETGEMNTRTMECVSVI